MQDFAGMYSRFSHFPSIQDNPLSVSRGFPPIEASPEEKTDLLISDSSFKKIVIELGILLMAYYPCNIKPFLRFALQF